jgi:hypothetical protein
MPIKHRFPQTSASVSSETSICVNIIGYTSVAATTYQQFSDSVLRDRKTIEANEITISKQRIEIGFLNAERVRLEITVCNAWMKVIDNELPPPSPTPMTKLETKDLHHICKHNRDRHRQNS